MGELWGADLAQLRALAKEFDAASQSLDNTVNEVTSMLSSVGWLGPSGDQFRDEWEGLHAPSIRQASTDLAGAKSAINRNADDQEGTSNDPGGIGVPGGGIGVPGGGIGVDAGQGVGVDGERPAEFYGEEPGWFRQLIDDLGPITTPPGLAAYALELLGDGGWSDAGKGAGGVFGVAGVLTGGYQTADSMVDFVFSGESGDLYSAGDGWVGAVLSGGSLVPPVAPAFAIAGAIWGGASLVNGLVSDRPLTQNLIDNSLAGTIYNETHDTQFSEDLADAAHDAYEPIFWEGMEITGDAIDGVESAADSVADAANDVVDGGRDLVEGAGDLLGF